jgi:DNA-binding CsgD family transcriptional regulator/tetratricopeptide (TPR) repeat protein
MELYRLTRGNPFFVTEIVAAGSSEIPPSARDAVFARVAPLPGQTRRAVEAAALIGATVEPSLLREVAEATEDDLDRLVAAGLLVSEDATLRFRHEITRLAVEEQIAAHRRGSVHARVLAALLAAGCADDARLAYHAEGAGDVAAVLHFAPRAARRAAEFAAHREAAAQFERALRFAGGADAMAVAELCDLLATEYALIDRFEDAAEVHERAVGLWREVGNQLRAGDTMRQLSRTLWRLCRGQECIAMAEAALSTLEPLGPSRELAWAYAIYAAMVMLDHDVERSIRAGHRALDLAEELDLPDVLSYALNTEAGVVADSDGEWTGMLLRALRVARDAGQVEQAGRAYSNLHTLYINEIRLSEAERCYLEGVTYCDEQDMATYLTCLQGWHATALDLQGRWDEAVAICEPALRIIASPVNRLTSLFALGRIRARRGESSAWECLDEAIENALGTAEDEWISLARLARTESRWLVGDLDAARDEIEGAYEYALRRNAWERGALATWLGRTRSALSVPAEAVAEPYALALAGRFDAAAAAWTRLGCPYQSALALFDSRTEPGLRDALRRFEALGAVAAVRVTRREMRLMGVRSIPTGAQEATRAHRAGLTRREGEVLDLICDGHTNAEISQKLFISERTVGHHVSAVLAKLGVKSRGVAAAEAVRRGLVRGPEK